MAIDLSHVPPDQLAAVKALIQEIDKASKYLPPEFVTLGHAFHYLHLQFKCAVLPLQDFQIMALIICMCGLEMLDDAVKLLKEIEKATGGKIYYA